MNIAHAQHNRLPTKNKKPACSDQAGNGILSLPARRESGTKILQGTPIKPIPIHTLWIRYGNGGSFCARKKLQRSFCAKKKLQASRFKTRQVFRLGLHRARFAFSGNFPMASRQFAGSEAPLSRYGSRTVQDSHLIPKIILRT